MAVLPCLIPPYMNGRDGGRNGGSWNATERGSGQALAPLKVRKCSASARPRCREWDAAGVLKAVQRTEGGHRRYRESDVRLLLAELEAVA